VDRLVIDFANKGIIVLFCLVLVGELQP